MAVLRLSPQSRLQYNEETHRHNFLPDRNQAFQRALDKVVKQILGFECSRVANEGPFDTSQKVKEQINDHTERIQQERVDLQGSGVLWYRATFLLQFADLSTGVDFQRHCGLCATSLLPRRALNPHLVSMLTCIRFPFSRMGIHTKLGPRPPFAVLGTRGPFSSEALRASMPFGVLYTHNKS